MKPHILFLFFVIGIGASTSCTRSIKIEIVRQSSDLNHCEIAFGTDLNSLRHENAILLQTGTIDTTDEQAPIPVAIVMINKKEIVLIQKNQADDGENIVEKYEGEEYKLTLKYKKEIVDNKESIFKGNFIIEYQNLQSEYAIVGTSCNL